MTSQSVESSSSSVTASVTVDGDAVVHRLAERARQLENHFKKPLLELLSEIPGSADRGRIS